MSKSTLFIVLLLTLFASVVFATPPMINEIFLINYEVSFVGESAIFEVEITVELLEDVDNGILWLENSELGPVLANLREYYYFSGKAGERKSFVLKGEYVPESKNNCLYLEVEVLDDEFNPLMYNTQKSITIYLSSPSETTQDPLDYIQEYLRIEDLMDSKPVDPQKNKFLVDLFFTARINIKGSIMPLKHVKVKLVEVDVVDNNVIAEGYTDEVGYIKLSGYAEDPLFDNPEVRWEIWSYVDPDEDNVAEVLVTTSSGSLYYVYSDEYTIEKDKQILETITLPDNGSVHYNTFRLCHMISELHEKDKSAGLNLFLTSKEVVIKYPSGDWPCSGGYTIYLPEDFFSFFSSRLHYVLAHEYGHCIDYHYNGYPKTSFSGSHLINTISDPGFALCEGWAEFYGYWLFGTEKEKNSINKGNCYNANAGPRYYDDWNGHSVEGSILALLWDVMDSDNESNLDFGSLSAPLLEKTTHSSKTAIVDFAKFVGGNNNDIRNPSVYGKLMTGNITINWIWNLFAYYGIDNIATFLFGTVLSGGVPVPNAKVYMNDNGVWSNTVYTDSNGRFFFDYRPHGSIENVKVNDVVFPGFVMNPLPSPGTGNHHGCQYTLPVTKHNLTVTTTPDTNLKVKIDGVESPSPFVKSVDKGSSHTIQAVTPQEKDLNNLVSGTDMRYTFEKWTDGNTANPRTVTVNSDVTYTAQMKVEYKVETATQPSGITTISGSGWYIQNTNKTFTAPTVTGYTFSHWLVNGDNAGSSSSLSLKIDNPKKVVAVYNTSSTKHNLTVTTFPYTGLDLKIDGTTYTSPRTLSVDKGTSHTIQVISPQEQDDTSKVSGTDMKYTFEKWTDGNTANPRTVTVNSDVTYTAQMKVECKIETATQPSGITTIAGSGWYIQNTNKTFTAPTVTGYTFSHWLVNGDNAGSSSSLSLKIDNPKKVVAVYNTSSTKHNLTVTTFPYTGLDLKIDGTTYTSPRTLSVDKGTSHTIQVISPQEQDDTSKVSGTDMKYTFEKWTDGNTANPRTVTVNSDVTYTAQMKVECKIETATQPSGITTIAGSGWYIQNTNKTFTAPTVTGYTFSHWLVNGDNAGSSSSLSLKIDNPKKVVAVYNTSTKHNLTVTTTPDTNLKVKIDAVESPSPFVKSVDKGSSHTIQAVTPQEKDLNNLVSGTDMRYTFEKWTDGNTANPRTVTVNSDVTYTAQMKVEYKVETATQPSGITTITGSGWYAANTNKTFTAPTVTGYTFSHWLVNGDNAGSSSSLSLKIDNPKKVVAVYENTSQNSGSLIIQGTANVSMQEFENGFLIWLRISGCNGMKAFELNLTATNSFTFEDIVFSSPNHIAGKKWSIVANNLQKKIVSVEAMSLDVAINGDQTLGYILCKTSTQILDWPILSGTFNWSDTQDKAYSAELLIVHYATDFNRDNEVTVGDLGFFANRYNSKLGDPKWNPICDLSGDGKIDFDDLSYFVNHWKH